ncbi:MAG: SRPBCC family protein [Leptospiraceae bacterium]|nr:SRPBCC family protein [Leptospiraceae bacterium]
MNKAAINPDLDLVLERQVDVSPDLVWKAWTTPEHLQHWFVPRPWTITACEIDLRPGGIFRTVMRSPEGDEFPNMGCYLEVVPNERLVWTDALLPGYRPAAQPESGAGLLFTAFLYLEAAGTGTRYTAVALHKDPADRQRHADMGFEQGWGTVVDQMVEYIKAQGVKI